jgi:hypothetical protein
MKETLGLTAAAILFSAGIASATPPPAPTLTHVAIDFAGASCTLSIYEIANVSNNIGKVLLAANSQDTCGFRAAGDIGRVKFSSTNNQRRATLAGISKKLGSSITFLGIFDYPFVTGGRYWTYYTSNGQTLHFIGKGQYTVK